MAVAALAAVGSFAVEHATAVPSAATATPGAPAPSFSAPDIVGKTVRLGDYAGKIAAGQPVAVASTHAYGCSIKYKDE